MARRNMPTIPDDKFRYFTEQLYRELSSMFIWKGLPDTIAVDYLERELIRGGRVLYYEHEDIGEDVLSAEPLGHNRHNMPTSARAIVKTTDSDITGTVVRKIRRLTDSENVKDDFDRLNDGVLISNMENGQSCKEIVEHFANRLAILQTAFDTNIAWANIPYYFKVESNEMKLTIEKMLYSALQNGEPFIMVDKHLFHANENRDGLPTDIPYIADKIMDTKNEVKMEFRQTIGIDSAGVDKAERVLDGEIKSNLQHTKTVLQIMLEQRKIAAENISAFFGRHVTVDVVGIEHVEQQGGDNNNGTSDSRTEEFTQD